MDQEEFRKSMAPQLPAYWANWHRSSKLAESQFQRATNLELAPSDLLLGLPSYEPYAFCWYYWIIAQNPSFPLLLLESPSLLEQVVGIYFYWANTGLNNYSYNVGDHYETLIHDVFFIGAWRDYGHIPGVAEFCAMTCTSLFRKSLTPKDYDKVVRRLESEGRTVSRKWRTPLINGDWSRRIAEDCQIPYILPTLARVLAIAPPIR